MRKRGWLQLLAVLVLGAFMALFAAGCGGGGPGDTVEKFFENMADRNFAEVYDMVSRDSPARKVSREEFIKTMEEAGIPEGASMSDYEVLEERIDGDRATVRFKATLKAPNEPDDTDEGTVELVNEDGEWKIFDF